MIVKQFLGTNYELVSLISEICDEDSASLKTSLMHLGCMIEISIRVKLNLN